MAAVLSLLLLIGCCRVVKKRFWVVLLFSSVLVGNCGYFLLSTLVFLVAVSPGILNIYYKQVSFEIIDGVSHLVKVYGPLHPIYLFYLLAHFIAMVTIIVRASIKKTLFSTSHAIVLAIAVFVNIGVWLIEQVSNFEFEMLSISYIISELFLLGVHLVMNENQRLQDIVNQVDSVQTNILSPDVSFCFSTEQIEYFLSGIQQLTATEKSVFDAHISRFTTKEILNKLNITENTLKYHNKNIYGKLGVSSKKELVEIYKQLNAGKENIK